MLRVTLKGLLAYKLRLALTALAVVLGVSFVSGTYVLTDTITSFFDTTFADANKGIDINVTVGQIGGVQNPDAFNDTERLAGSTLDTVKGVEGVEVADGIVQGFAQMLDKNGERYGGLGPPTLGFSWGNYEPFSPLRLREGREPRAPDEIAVDVVSARKMGYRVGEPIRVVLQGPAQDFTIVGIVGFGRADNLGGATIVSWASPVAQQVLQKSTDWDSIAVKVAPGYAVGDVIEKISDVLPAGHKVQTGQAAAQENADAINNSLGLFTTAMLFFAGIALFVGAFIIANTFSIIVAQRSRELALLRSIGASRTQIMGSVLLEALIIGFVASVIGLGLGLGIGAGLRKLVDAVSGGGGLPGSQVGLRQRTVIVGLSVGTITTFLSALLPAVRGSRQPPIAALRHEAIETSSNFSVRRLVVGVTAAVLAALTLGYAMYGDDVPLRFAFIGLGALGVFLGIAMLSPLTVRPVARVLGAPIAKTGMPGLLARENSRRNPQRTASTAGALMIGIAVVAAVSTLASSIDKSIAKVLDRTVKADIVLSNRQGTVDPSVEERVRQQPGIAAVVPVRFNQFRLGGKQRSVIAIPAANTDAALDLEVVEGALADLAGGGVLLHEDIASKLGKGVGDTMRMGFPKGAENLVVRGIFENNQVTLGANYVLALSDYERLYTEQQDLFIYAVTDPGRDPTAVASSIAKELRADFPQVDVLDQKAFTEQQSEQIQQLLAIVFALLMLSIIIALLGIANTLALSVFERTREIGLLRAVGTSRRQTRRMIRYESIIIAVLGAVLGIVIGLAFGGAAVGALRDEGLTELSFPVATMIIVLLLSGVAGVLAAIFPARRAANLDVLQAIAAAE